MTLWNSLKPDSTQAVMSVLAFILSIYAVYISKKTANATFKTIVRPTDMFFPQPNFDEFVLKLYNSGPGTAFDVKITAYEIKTYVTRKYLLKGTWRKHKLIYAEGTTEVQPNQSTDFTFNGLDVFYFHHKRPILISYRLANNKKFVSYWNFMMGESRKKRMSKMSWWEIMYYKIINRFFVDRVK